MGAKQSRSSCPLLKIDDQIVVGTRGCKLDLHSVVVPQRVETIGKSAFYGCRGLTSLTLPPSLNRIDAAAFQDCIGLMSLTLPDNLTVVGNSAFQGCSGFTCLTLPSDLTSIGVDAFNGCSGLTSLILPHNLTSIGHYAFHWCSGLTQLTLPRTLTSVGNCAFGGCRGLTSITLAHTLSSVGDYAFQDCTALTSVVFRPSASHAFLAWAVGSSRNRANWQLTILKRMRNVLKLITLLTFCCRNVADIDPHGFKGVFKRCYNLRLARAPRKVSKPGQQCGRFLDHLKAGDCADESPSSLDVGSLRNFDLRNFARRKSKRRKKKHSSNIKTFIKRYTLDAQPKAEAAPAAGPGAAPTSLTVDIQRLWSSEDTSVDQSQIKK